MLKDLENRKVGSMTDLVLAGAQKDRGHRAVTLRQYGCGVARSPLAGRVDALVGDPPVIDYALSKPGLGPRQSRFTDNNPDFPLLTGLGRHERFRPLEGECRTYGRS